MVISVAARKAKGRKLQKEIAAYISELLDIPFGQDELISSREMGQSGTDVRLMGEAKTRFPYSIECKWQETWSLLEWIKQAKSNTPENSDWLLFCKKNNQDSIVVMDTKVFFKLYKQIIGDKNSDKQKSD